MYFTPEGLRDTLLNHHRLHGYEPVESSVIASADLFLEHASDTVIPQLYTFERRGKLLVLQPEFTTSAMSRYLESGSQQPARWQFFGPTFQTNSALSHGYYHQSLSAGVELLNVNGVLADIEVLLMAWEGAQLLTSEPLTLHLNHTGLLHSLLQQFDLDPFQTRLVLTQGQLALKIALRSDAAHTEAPSDPPMSRVMLDALLDSSQYGTTMGGRDRQDILNRLERKRQRQHQYTRLESAVAFLSEWHGTQIEANQIESLSRFMDSSQPESARLLEEWKIVIDHLIQAGIQSQNIRIQLDVAPNWHYYTGIAFSVTQENHTLISGGRYNNLGQSIQPDRSVPAIGFAYFLDRYITYDNPISVTTVAADNVQQAITIVKLLRTAGIVTTMGVSDTSTTNVYIKDDQTMTLNGRVVETTNDLISQLKAQR